MWLLLYYMRRVDTYVSIGSHLAQTHTQNRLKFHHSFDWNFVDRPMRWFCRRIDSPKPDPTVSCLIAHIALCRTRFHGIKSIFDFFAFSVVWIVIVRFGIVTPNAHIFLINRSYLWTTFCMMECNQQYDEGKTNKSSSVCKWSVSKLGKQNAWPMYRCKQSGSWTWYVLI